MSESEYVYLTDKHGDLVRLNTVTGMTSMWFTVQERWSEQENISLALRTRTFGEHVPYTGSLSPAMVATSSPHMWEIILDAECGTKTCRVCGTVWYAQAMEPYGKCLAPDYARDEFLPINEEPPF